MTVHPSLHMYKEKIEIFIYFYTLNLIHLNHSFALTDSILTKKIFSANQVPTWTENLPIMPFHKIIR